MATFNIEGYNVLSGGTYQFDIHALNKICTDQGGSGDHLFVINALNEIAGTVGAATDAPFNIIALNRICVAVGGLGGHLFEIQAINELITLWPPLAKAYTDRVTAGSGIVLSASTVIAIYQFLSQQALYTGTELLFDANSGMVQRIDGVLKYVRTAFDLSANDNDLDGSSTATFQPRLVGGIAPNSKYAASNQNGEARYFTHTPISFAAGDAWSVSLVTKFDGTSQAVHSMIGSSPNVDFGFKNGTNVFWFRNTNGGAFVSALPISNLIGKKTKITLVANGLGLLSIYVNGVFFESISIATNITLSRFFYGSVGTTYIHNGLINYYRIQSGAMTAAQVLSESTFLSTLYPEVESIIIGTQTWATRNFEAVCTPMGNVIPEMQAAAAVEKITNAADREFTSDSGFWTKETGFSITGNAMVGTSVANLNKFYKGFLTLGKKYKITYQITDYVAGGIKVEAGTGASGTIRSANGIYTEELVCTTNTDLNFRVSGTTTLKVDNVSCQELGWANATEIYDAAYAADGGDATAKTYAGLKAAAMWCCYNNDAANGAIHGKLYNWYAVKLFDLDMASASFGWHVPTSTEFTTLQTYLGGVAVAGGKMKMTGLNYWATPNTGATNESGFTALANGLRLADGSFSELNITNRLWTSTSGNLTYNLNTDAVMYITSSNSLIRGCAIRLIKN